MEGEGGPEEQEPKDKPSTYICLVEVIGYCEVNVNNPVYWYSGWPYFLLATLCAKVLAQLWWRQFTTSYGGLLVFLYKALLAAAGGWSYLRWVSPLQYESVAIKRHLGLEVCTRWKLFEETVVVPLAHINALTLHLVSDDQFRLVVKGRGDQTLTCFRHNCPNFYELVQAYTALAVVLPRNVRKGQVAAYVPEFLSSFKLGRWLMRQVHFTTAGVNFTVKSAVGSCKQWWRAGYYWCLRSKNRVQQSERWQQWAARFEPLQRLLAPLWALLWPVLATAASYAYQHLQHLPSTLGSLLVGLWEGLKVDLRGSPAATARGSSPEYSRRAYFSEEEILEDLHRQNGGEFGSWEEAPASKRKKNRSNKGKGKGRRR